ncbi:TIGR02117 family protein [Sphingomonas sp. Mn802worker]|uniref:TIGR02117 family protein n=1 Tax=Sphingomonas sp. Mn802worker TaxID=629773 RepID=UPI00055A7EA4|nr:TIGR02117 family protein [Sphingomonas sp. Mn802worker]
MRRQARLFRISARVVVGIVELYLAAGLIGGALLTSAGWSEPQTGVAIWVEDNGIHTDLVLPKQAAGVDWRGVFGAEAIRQPIYADYPFVAVGWGERQFFVDTPTWRDARVGTVIAAALGSDMTVLHVEHVARPVGGEHVRRIVLRPGEYRQLAKFVRASLGEGRSVRGYAGHDAFYPARGRYDALHTCNTWTGRALAAAGVRVGVWTPFPATVGWWL